MNAQNAHTPGPWEVQELTHARGELWLQIGYSGCGPIVRMNCTAEPMAPGVIAESKYMATSQETQRANARLIAAAPELLAVCKQIFKEAKNIESDGYMDDDARPVYEALRAAIAKATGEQP